MVKKSLLAGSLPFLINQFCPGEGIFILTPVSQVGLIKYLFLWNLIFFCAGYCEITFCKVFLTKRRCQLQSLELCFTTHPHWTAHTSVIKDRKLLAIEKIQWSVAECITVFALFQKKKTLQKNTLPRLFKHVQIFFFPQCNSKAIVGFWSGAEGRGYWEITVSPFLLAESWRSLP